MWLIYPQEGERNKALNEKSRAKALSSAAVSGEVHQIFKKTLSFELVSSYLEKVEKDYNQLEEKPLNVSLKWKKLCRTTAGVHLSSSYKTDYI